MLCVCVVTMCFNSCIKHLETQRSKWTYLFFGAGMIVVMVVVATAEAAAATMVAVVAMMVMVVVTHYIVSIRWFTVSHSPAEDN